MKNLKTVVMVTLGYLIFYPIILLLPIPLYEIGLASISGILVVFVFTYAEGKIASEESLSLLAWVVGGAILGTFLSSLITLSLFGFEWMSAGDVIPVAIITSLINGVFASIASLYVLFLKLMENCS